MDLIPTRIPATSDDKLALLEEALFCSEDMMWNLKDAQNISGCDF